MHANMETGKHANRHTDTQTKCHASRASPRAEHLQDRKLGELGSSLGARGVTLTLEYSDTLHDRYNAAIS